MLVAENWGWGCEVEREAEEMCVIRMKASKSGYQGGVRNSLECGIQRWFAGESYFMGKLVLEELVIVQSSGVGSGMQKTAFNRICLGNGHGWLVRMHGAGLQGNSRG